MILTNIDIHNSATTEALNAKFEAIFPTWPTVVATILAILILFLIMTKLFYNPIKKMVAERKKFIQSNIDNAIHQNEMAASDRKQATLAINEANTIAQNIIAEAKIKAEEIMKKSIEDAKSEANQLIKNVHKEAQREKEIFEIQAKKEIVTIALEAAKNVINKEVDSTLNKRLVQNFINENFASKDKHDS